MRYHRKKPLKNHDPMGAAARPATSGLAGGLKYSTFGPVVSQFQIEDLVEQSEWEGIYLAVDNASGECVTLRRFFPFGAKGGGLKKNQLESYEAAINRLSKIRHASLRGVIAGGWDPVDRMPYIATELANGNPLQTMIEAGLLNANDTIMLVRQALAMSLLYSEALAEDALWVETAPSSIRVVDGDHGPHFNFCFSPFKWLHSKSETLGYEDIIALTETVMHWQGRMVAADAGLGLGGWLKWMRESTPAPNLHEALEKLPRINDHEPRPTAGIPAASTTGPAAATEPAVKVSAKSSRAPILIAVSLALIVVALLVWHGRSPSTNADMAATPIEPDPVIVEAPAEEKRTLQTQEPPEEMAETNLLALEPSGKKELHTDEIDPQPADPDVSDRVHLITDRDVLMKKNGEQAVLEGVLANVRFSGLGNGPTFYLEFSDPAPIDEPRAYIMRANMTPDMQPDVLQSLIGKRVRMAGVVHVEKVNIHGVPGVRPRVRLDGRESIELVDQ